jgi:alkylhydroperoxidase family enzyme
LFNEDEWRNGVQTAGYVSRRLKELVIQKAYRANRCRYGIEHHTMYFYNTYMAEFGMWPAPLAELTPEQQEAARTAALSRADQATLFAHDHRAAPAGTYTDLELAVADWSGQVVRNPHLARDYEAALRSALDQENRREIAAGLRTLDTSPDLDQDAALKRLEDHQVAELAMVTGHMNGLARVLTILRLEAEEGVQMVAGRMEGGGIVPDLNENGQVQFTGYYNNRPSMHQVLGFVGIDPSVIALNELLVNPDLCVRVREHLQTHETIEVSAEEARETGEF